MISQLTGAGLRALLVVAMIVTPSLLLPQDAPEVADAVILIAFCAAVFTVLEYGAIYPGLVEFRDAPPFNRTRFAILALTVLMIAGICAGREEPSALSRLVFAVGVMLGHAMDFPWSPIRLILWLLPEGTTMAEAQIVRAAAGLAYLVALVGITLFAILIRLYRWPGRSGAFNVWINLPTFEPTAGADVVRRLRSDGRFNILLGIVLPYLSPPVAGFVGGVNGISLIESDLVLVWSVALWAFLPASLFLRGIAMRRLALMIEAKRRRVAVDHAAVGTDFLPA
ncbi:hypothetical protein [Jannaschia sp. W003]|uniref:hypothetical protein n=1 Tax=Jannaschia sp. W003 TaxID=2867012 RepID=UPI0021A4629E|nr:hypothetical protein [Jannaschia sp. W003]UWQ21874.1 hypothetical protein K3554_02260 [Jannaschia sp. W003]